MDPHLRGLMLGCADEKDLCARRDSGLCETAGQSLRVPGDRLAGRGHRRTTLCAPSNAAASPARGEFFCFSQIACSSSSFGRSSSTSQSRTPSGVKELKIFLPFIPLWILRSVCIGIASLALADAVDEALFAFSCAAGAGFVVWFVLLAKAVLVGGMRVTLQLSIHAEVTGIACSGLALSAGSFSVLSAVLWIIRSGISSKNS
jgi:hypothetical protein